jgi:hypothetical protein
MKRITATFALPLLALTSGVFAGPLAPPAGPVAPTMKTLTEIEPRTPLNAHNTPSDSDSVYRITQPGSYYLTGSMTVPAGRHGIEIAADGVSIDLMGFVVQGESGSKDGITTTNVITRRHLRIANGVVRGMGASGIFLSGHMAQSAQGHHIERVIAAENGAAGIAISDGVITDSQGNDNGWDGIRASSLLSTTVSGCTATNNSGDGITISNGIVTNSTATSNTGSGMVVGQNGVVSDSVASKNQWGFAGAGLTIDGCVAADNWQGGITANSRLQATRNFILSHDSETGTIGIRVLLGDGSRIESNNILGQATGIAVNSPGNLVVGNTLRANITAVSIAAGNRVGSLINTPVMGAVVGNTGGGSLGSTDPNANLLY